MRSDGRTSGVQCDTKMIYNDASIIYNRTPGVVKSLAPDRHPEERSPARHPEERSPARHPEERSLARHPEER